MTKGDDGSSSEKKFTALQIITTIVQIFGIFSTFVAACIAAYVSYQASNRAVEAATESAQRAESLQLRIQELQSSQNNAELAFRANQANRDIDRQYIALIYVDLTSNNRQRQQMAISLVSAMEPNTGIRLLTWASESNLILPENRSQARAVEAILSEDSSRFIVFVHIGRDGNRPVPERDRVLNAINQERMTVGGVDNLWITTGPVVHYFHPQDEAGARRLAAAMQSLLPPGSTVNAIIPQGYQNRQGRIGVWF